jgi:hypothetical protein
MFDASDSIATHAHAGDVFCHAEPIFCLRNRCVRTLTHMAELTPRRYRKSVRLKPDTTYCAKGAHHVLRRLEGRHCDRLSDDGLRSGRFRDLHADARLA